MDSLRLIHPTPKQFHHRGTVSNELKWAKVPKMSKMKERNIFLFRKQPPAQRGLRPGGSLLLQELLAWCPSCRSNLWLRFESVINSEIRNCPSDSHPSGGFPVSQSKIHSMPYAFSNPQSAIRNPQSFCPPPHPFDLPNLFQNGTFFVLTELCTSYNFTLI